MKLFLYASNAIIFAMYWSLFTIVLDKWWIGLIAAILTMCLQIFTQKQLNKVKIKT